MSADPWAEATTRDEPDDTDIIAMALQAWGASALGPENPDRREWQTAAMSALRRLRQSGWLIVNRSEQEPMGLAAREIERLRAERDAARDRVAQSDDLLNYAWTIICNAGEGDWTRESADWRRAAAKFREQYHAYLDAHHDALVAEQDR